MDGRSIERPVAEATGITVLSARLAASLTGGQKESNSVAADDA
jgi:hypothetical protein